MFVEVAQQYVVRTRSAIVSNFNQQVVSMLAWKPAESLTPLRFDTKEHPEPTPKHLEKFHKENTALEIIEMIQVRGEFEAPRATEKKVNDDYSIVYFVANEIPAPAETPRVLGIISLE